MILGNIDLVAIQLVQSFSGPALDMVFRLISFLGNPAFWIIVGTVLYWIGKEKQGINIFNLVLIVTAVVGALKFFFAVPRPEGIRKVYENVLPGAFSPGIVTNLSFPSGHTTTAAACSAYVLRKKRGFLTALLIALPFAVALSRIYLGMHFLSDVLAGLLLGCILGLINRKMRKLFDKYEFRLSRINDEIIFIGISLLAAAIILFLETPLIAIVVLGIYAGHYASKELNFKQEKLHGKRALVKVLLGMFTVTVLLLTTVLLPFLTGIIAFITGIWISLGYPLIYSRLILKEYI